MMHRGSRAHPSRGPRGAGGAGAVEALEVQGEAEDGVVGLSMGMGSFNLGFHRGANFVGQSGRHPGVGPQSYITYMTYP